MRFYPTTAMFWYCAHYARIIGGYNAKSNLKIRMGYILKSAEVRTLVSRTILKHTHIPLNTFRHTQATNYPFHKFFLRNCNKYISAHALNLINHMKLYINIPNKNSKVFE